MKLFNALLKLCSLAPMVLAGPLFQERNQDFCKDVDFVVSILKINKATPFCSSYLKIPTATATALSTSIIPTTTVVPGPTILSTTVTGTDTTTETDLTSTTSVTTTITDVASVSTSVVIITTSTTTTYTLRKREAQDPHLEARGGLFVPGFLNAFKSSVISKACSCLSIPTPTTTATVVTTTSTTLITTGPPTTSVISTFTSTTTTTTSVDIIFSTTITTATIPTTLTITTTSSSVSVSTFIPAACKNPTLLNNAYFPAFTPGFDIVPISNGYSAQRCCSRCHTTPNCIAWAWGGFLSPSLSSCYSILNTVPTTPAPAALQAICPLGILPTEQLATGEPPNMSGEYGFGPCDIGGLAFN